MIAQFPQFKRLELSDQKAVEKLTQKFDPYSDFDFSSMWSWDINKNFKISTLNGNLIILFTDHFSDELFCSFLGHNEVNKTLKQLFAFPFRDDGKDHTLRVVPEVSLQGIDFNKYIIEIDLNNYDYIYDLREHVSYTGNKFSTKRKLCNRFLKKYPQSVVQILNLGDKETITKILDLSRDWAETKNQESIGINLSKEFSAIQNFLEFAPGNALCVGTILDGRLIGYEIFTCLKNHYAISHFAKTLTKYVGLYEYQTSQSARILLNKNIRFLNAEEDLGLPDLRFSKNSYRPIRFLRKYTVREK
jgi:uncharacterized protein